MFFFFWFSWGLLMPFHDKNLMVNGWTATKLTIQSWSEKVSIRIIPYGGWTFSTTAICIYLRWTEEQKWVLNQSRPFFCSVSGLYTECGLKNPLGFTSSSGCHRVLELLLVSSTSGGMNPDLTLLLIQTITKQCGLQSLFGRASSFHLQEDRLDVWCFLRVSSAGWCCLPVNVCPSHAYFLFPCDSTYLITWYFHRKKTTHNRNTRFRHFRAHFFSSTWKKSLWPPVVVEIHGFEPILSRRERVLSLRIASTPGSMELTISWNILKFRVIFI